MVTLKFWMTGNENHFYIAIHPMKDLRFLEEYDCGSKENVAYWLGDLLEEYDGEQWRYLALEDDDGDIVTIDLNKVQAFSVMYPEDA